MCVTLIDINRRTIAWISAAVLAAIFGFDWVTHLGYVVPIFYVLPLLITWFVPGMLSTYLILGIVLVLTWVGIVFSPGEITLVVVANRAMASALLVVVAYLVINQCRLEEQRVANLVALQKGEAQSTADVAALKRLERASERLWLAATITVGLEQMLHATIELLEADKGNIQLFDAERGVLVITVQQGFEPDFLDFFREVSVIDNSACARALHTGKRIIIEDVEADELYAAMCPVARAAGYRAVQSTPLMNRDGTAMGMISTHFRAPHRPSEHQLRLLDLYARQAENFIERCRGEEKLHESEQRLRLFIEHAPVAIAMLDTNMRYLVVSGRWLTDYALVGQDLSGRSHYEIFPEIPERWKAVHRRCLAGEVEHADEDLFIRADGSRQWLRWAVHPWRTASETVGGIVIFSEDITERKQVEEAVAKAELYYRTIFQEAGVGVAQIDSHTGKFVKVNRKYCEIVGRTEDEMLATTFMHITHPDDLTEDLGFMERIRSGELSTFTMEKRYIKKDGSIVWVTLNVAPLWRIGETPSQHIAIVQDITIRRQMEIVLRESEERFRHVFEFAGMGIAIIEVSGAFVHCNPAYCAMIGYTEEELRHLAFALLIHPDDRNENQQALDALLKNKQPSFEIENRYIHKAGHAVWVRKSVSILYGKDGNPTHIISLVTDITEQKRGEAERREWYAMLEDHVKKRTAELVEANERWDWVVRATHDGVWDWDLTHDTVYYSPRWKEMHGFQDSDPLETMKEWSGRLHPDDRPRVLKKLESYLAGTELVFWEEYRIQRKDGVYFWVLDRGVALWGEEGRAVRMVGAETDITWRKEAEETLHRREQEFRTLADNVPALFSYIDQERRYRFVNKRYEELFGRSDEEMIGVTVSDLLGTDGYTAVESYLNQALKGESVSFEYELKILGDGVKHLSVQYVPDRDEQGLVVGVFALLADITALKTTETALRERESQLRALSIQLLRVQEEERRRLARDLHDDVTQRLAVLTLELHGMGRYAVEAGYDPSLVSHVRGLAASTEQLTTDVQQLAHQLHPSILEHVGLEAAVREAAEDFATRNGLTVEILTREMPRHISLDQATCLYRVLQECLQNVRKHAQASNVLVRLLGTNRGIGLCVHDDGNGFALTPADGNRKSLGLTSMAERVRALGGTLRIRTKQGDSTEIHAWIPVEDVMGDVKDRR